MPLTTICTRNWCPTSPEYLCYPCARLPDSPWYPSPCPCPSAAFAQRPLLADSLQSFPHRHLEPLQRERIQPRRLVKWRGWERSWCLATRLERLPLLPRPPRHSMHSLPNRAIVSHMLKWLGLTHIVVNDPDYKAATRAYCDFFAITQL
jgi:hypothetical protein